MTETVGIKPIQRTVIFKVTRKVQKPKETTRSAHRIPKQKITKSPFFFFLPKAKDQRKVSCHKRNLINWKRKYLSFEKISKTELLCTILCLFHNFFS